MVCKREINNENWKLLGIGEKCAAKYMSNRKRYDRNNISLGNKEKGLDRIKVTPETLEMAQNGTLSESVSSNKNIKGVERFYLNARNSKIQNVGEDVKGAAKHRALEWTTLEDLEALGEGGNLKRSQLLRNLPVKGLNDLAKRDFKKALVVSTMLKGYPASPDAMTIGYYGKYWVDQAEMAHEEAKPYALECETINPRFRPTNSEESKLSQCYKFGLALNIRKLSEDELPGDIRGVSKEEYLKLRRKFYFEGYSDFKSHIEREIVEDSKNPGSVTDMTQKLSKIESSRIEELRGGKNTVFLQSLIGWYNSCLRLSRSPRSAYAKISEYDRTLNSDSNDIDGSFDKDKFIEEYFSKGKSLAASLGVNSGTVKNTKKRLRMRDFFKKTPIRTGPELS